LNLASLAAAAPVKVVDKAKIFTAGSTSSSSITHIDAAAAIAKAGAAGKVAKFSEIFESKAQATAPTTIGSGNYTTGSSTSDAAIPRSLGRSPSVSRHPVVTSRPVILTRGPAKAI
jgi:hypothetical protein